MLKNPFSTKYMIKPADVVGDIPPSGHAYRTSLRIALPGIVEITSLVLLQMISIAMLRDHGATAVAAVGLTTQPRMIMMSLFFALNVGVTAVVARRRGEDDRTAARLCLRQGLMISLGVGVLMSLLSVVLAEPLMTLAGANYDTMSPATAYFRITGAALFINSVTMTISAAYRGIGNTRVTMMVNVAANIVSVVFHYLLIDGQLFFPALGVEGAAIAMVISSVAALILAVASVLKKGGYIRVTRKCSWRPDLPMIKSIAKVGGNSIFEQMCLRIGFFVYAIVVASLGTEAFAAHQLAIQLMHLSFAFADGIAVASTALVGQNLGRKRPDLAILYGKLGQRMAFMVSMALVVFVVLARNWYPTMFTDDVQVITYTTGLMLIMVAILPFQTSQLVMAGSLRGAGDTRYVAITMLITMALVRPFSSIMMVSVMQLGLYGAWFSVIVDQILRLALLYGRFVRGKWTKIKV